MQAYLDNSATTRCSQSVLDVVTRAMMEDYGNPSSKHDKGMQAEQYLRKAREQIAGTLKVSEKEVFFTSGGTESDNWALIGAARANRRLGRHLVATAVEHAAVSGPLAWLEEQGFEVTYVPVDRYGRIDPEQLAEAVREDTILISTMYVNNEIGSLEPMEEIAGVIRRKNSRALWHVDAIQAYGKYRIFPKKLGIDFLAVSGHKIHGPKGVGFLYIDGKAKIQPLLLGGGQQGGMRSGTDNVPGIAGLGCAAQEAYADFEAKTERLYELKDFFMQGVSKLPDVVLNSLPGRAGAPHIVSVSFRGVRSEVLLHALEERGIQVSAGSACSSNKRQATSPVLRAIGLERELLDSTVRFSFSTYTTREELAYTLEQLHALLPALRRYSRR